MGSMKAQNAAKDESGFRINLFPTDQEEEEEASVVSFIHSFHLRCTPKHTLIHNSLTFALVDRGASAGAHESLFGVVNIQAMQVQLAAMVHSSSFDN